jgi:hypothetical protein
MFRSYVGTIPGGTYDPLASRARQALFWLMLGLSAPNVLMLASSTFSMVLHY